MPSVDSVRSYVIAIIGRYRKNFILKRSINLNEDYFQPSTALEKWARPIEHSPSILSALRVKFLQIFVGEK